LRNTGLGLPAIDLGPPFHEISARQPGRIALLAGESDQSVGAPCDALPLPAEVIEHVGEVQGPRQIVRVRPPVSQGQRLAACLEGAVREAEEPKAPGVIREARHHGVVSRGAGLILSGVIEGDRALEMIPGQRDLSEMEPDLPQHGARSHEVRGIVSALAQAEPPLVAVEALGCVLCEAGQVATFRVNIANPDGVTRIVHLIVQVELPTGDIVPLVEEPVLLQTRFTQRLLVSHPVTPADPAGTYWFDAAIFDSEDERRGCAWLRSAMTTTSARRRR